MEKKKHYETVGFQTESQTFLEAGWAKQAKKKQDENCFCSSSSVWSSENC